MFQIQAETEAEVPGLNLAGGKNLNGRNCTCYPSLPKEYDIDRQESEMTCRYSNSRAPGGFAVYGRQNSTWKLPSEAQQAICDM